MNRITQTPDTPQVPAGQGKKKALWIAGGLGAALLVTVAGLSLNQAPAPKQAQTKAPQTSSTKKEDPQEALLASAEKAVAFLENNQETKNVSPAQQATDKLTDKTKKASYQKRVDAVKAAIAVREGQARDLAEAERLVKALEDNQVTENIAPAQGATDKVADQGKKGTLQTRIDAVKHAIQVRADQAAQAAAQAAQAQAQAAAETPSYEAPSDGGYYQAGGGYQGGGQSYTTVSGSPTDASYWTAAGYDPASAASIAAAYASGNPQGLVNAVNGANGPTNYSWATGQ